MVRAILGVIVGYVAFSVALFIFLSILYMILGTSGSFQTGNFELTMSWLLAGVVIFFVAGAIASTVCGLIAKNAKAGLYMGATILLIGILIAVMQLASDPGITVRDIAEVPLMDAMNKAHGPIWSFFVNPLAGFIGALSGGNLFKKGE